MENKHYLYYHFNPITRKLFYIGVGMKNRAYAFKWGRSKHYYNYIKKYGDPIVIIRYRNLEVDYAYKLEENLIKKFGRIGIEPNGVLINKSSGGKTSGSGVRQIRSKEWNNNIGDGNRGKPKHNILGKNSIRDKNSKPIIQYDEKGNIINEFSSIKEASYVLNIDKKKIDNYLQKPKVKLENNIILKYKNPSTSRKGKTILCFDENWNFIKEYISVNQAQRDLNVVGISQFFNGKSHYIGKNKYKFKYK
jgi:hypothetical protein